jgi:hypothetical protein
MGRSWGKGGVEPPQSKVPSAQPFSKQQAAKPQVIGR